MKNKWSTPEEKLSHEGRTLRQHIEEVKSFLKNFLDFYNFPERYIKIANFLAEHHDYGKLHEDWKLGEKKGHSHHSYEYLIEKDISFEEKQLNPVLQFLILKHHSTLSSKISKNLGEKKIELKGREFSLDAVFNVITGKELKNTIEGLYKSDIEELINLVDVFGLFKLADICSAEGVSFKFEKPEVNENIVYNFFSNSLDEKRWNEQKKLVYLPDIALLRAYTGWGKTTAGLLFFVKKSPLKIFYLMPTITAINKFYEKLKNSLGDKISKYFYFLDTEIKEDEERLSQLIFFENFTTPYVITTIDQFLLSFLQTGKYYTKRVMFRNSGLIIDEVHLLNPLMLYLVNYFIKIYRKLYNLKVLFMSATLPDSLVNYLKENLQISDSSFLDFSNGYETKKRVMWKWIDEDIEKYLEKIVEKKNEGKKVLVIVNTVEKAIKVGRKLEEDFRLNYGKDFIVFHARFMYKHRKEKEKWVEEMKEKPHILVATQVCEVSLDISYDILFTELASLPALIQRFGRTNRYRERTEEINVYIFKPEIRDEKKYPYSKEDLENAEKVIRELEENNLKNERQLIEKLNEICTYEKLLKEIENAKKEVNVENWEKILKFFFSLDVNEKDLRSLLDYREGFTVMVIPEPNCIVDETKKEVEKLLSVSFSGLSFRERQALFAQIKELAVPVPIWWTKGVIKKEEKGFPIVCFKDKVYNKKYGFQELRSEII